MARRRARRRSARSRTGGWSSRVVPAQRSRGGGAATRRSAPAATRRPRGRPRPSGADPGRDPAASRNRGRRARPAADTRAFPGGPSAPVAVRPASAPRPAAFRPERTARRQFGSSIVADQESEPLRPCRGLRGARRDRFEGPIRPAARPSGPRPPGIDRFEPRLFEWFEIRGARGWAAAARRLLGPPYRRGCWYHANRVVTPPVAVPGRSSSVTPAVTAGEHRPSRYSGMAWRTEAVPMSDA